MEAGRLSSSLDTVNVAALIICLGFPNFDRIVKDGICKRFISVSYSNGSSVIRSLAQP